MTRRGGVTGPGVVAPRGGGGPQNELPPRPPTWPRAGRDPRGGCCRVGPAEIKELADRVGTAPTDR